VDIHALGTSTDPREVGDYREFERQADKFAAYLLMPEHLVRREWRQIFGTEAPLVISPEAEAAGTENLGSREAFLSAFAEFNSRQLADRFRVSVPAMRIRLQELSLLPRL
jgi:Zn-dependent peptidase ImmA (M78 family)